MNSIDVRNVSLRRGDFELKDVSFTVPRGSIVGLIGENGAGKSTTLGIILGITRPDSGDVAVLGERFSDVRTRVGVVFDGSNFPDPLTPAQIESVFEKIYPSWNSARYSELLRRLEIPSSRSIKKLSRGMKMKLSLAVALAHEPELLILDEATSGLDPVVRDDILDMFLEFVEDESHSVLVSSHITSDLEKVADRIVFLHGGSVVFERNKDELIYGYGIMRMSQSQYQLLNRADALAMRRRDYEYDVLVASRAAAQRKYPGVTIDPATIDEIMLMYVKGEVL